MFDLPFEIKVLLVVIIVGGSLLWIFLVPKRLYVLYTFLLTLSLTNAGWSFIWLYERARGAGINNDMRSVGSLEPTVILRSLLPSIALCALVYVLTLAFLKQIPLAASTLPFILCSITELVARGSIENLVSETGLYAAALEFNGPMFSAISLVTALFFSFLLFSFITLGLHFSRRSGRKVQGMSS